MANTPPKITTRLRLLLTAERLFSEKGLDQVTTKEILAAAEQRNESALQYHFGSREKLIRTILDLRVNEVDLRRVELMDALEAKGRDKIELREIVRVAIQPLSERINDPEARRFIVLMSYVVADPRFDIVGSSIRLGFPGIRRCRRWMQVHMKGCDAAIQELRLRMVIELGVGALGSAARELEFSETPRDMDLFLEQLLDTLTAHLQSAPSDQTLAIIQKNKK
ncbi:MAG: AcrR family transcriptional regulator [Parvibaculaceae bacterium]|jgi:AcrR family transcriptional regulator|nr:helix-turn-helix domain containing protein [Parvibaculaceae bacterium]